MPDGPVPEDAGVMRCICGFDHDDDFTIQCEECNTWQHAVCVGIFSYKAVPDVYACPRCGHREFDSAVAAERQIRRLDSIKRQVRNRREELATDKADNQHTHSPSPDHQSDQGHQSQGQQSSQQQRKKPGRKKKLREDAIDEPVPNPRVYFVPCSENTLTPAAAAWLHSAGSLKERGLRTVDIIHQKPPSIHVVRKSRAFGLPGLATVASQSIPRDRFVVDFTGELCLESEYRADPVNQWDQLGTVKQGVTEVPHLPLVMDGRRHGSEAIFLRRSRTPNVRLEAVISASTQALHVIAFTTEPVKPGTELTVPWGWSPDHPIHRLRQGVPIEQLDSIERAFIERAVSIVNRPLLECIPTDPVEPEVSVAAENTPAITGDTPVAPAPKRNSAAAIIRKQFKRDQRQHSTKRGSGHEDPLEALAENVWQPAPLPSGAPPKKKKLSLADYKRKFSATE